MKSLFGLPQAVLAAVALSSLAASRSRSNRGAERLQDLSSVSRTLPQGMELAVGESTARAAYWGARSSCRSGRQRQPGVRCASPKIVSREKAVLLWGHSPRPWAWRWPTSRSSADLFIASEPLTDKIVWENGNRYTFRLRPSTYMQTAMLVPEAAKLGKKRWAIVYPNYEYGSSATAAFKQQMIASQASGIEFVEIAVPLGKIDAGPVVQALLDAKPDAIFSSLFATDLAKFVREGELRGLFRDRPVFNLLGGEPEYLDPLKEEAPAGWYVTGYPWDAIATPEHKRFLDAYQAKYKDYPRQGSIVGYSVVMTAAAAIRKARSTETEKLVAAMQGLIVDTPFGKVSYRALDHQSTMGAFVGRVAVKDGKGVMVDWRYAEGRNYLPSDDWVRAHRPAD
jgi:branched-chain amino acid transport system substrate-binding protein